MKDDDISDWSDPRDPWDSARPSRRARSATAKRDPERAPLVTVFGAGIAGLTAAHELAERGFRVQVVERIESRELAGQVEIGGLARSQWGRIKAPLDELHADLDAAGSDGLREDEQDLLRRMIAFTRRYWIQTEPAVECDLSVLFESGAPLLRTAWMVEAAAEAAKGALDDPFRKTLIEHRLGLSDRRSLEVQPVGASEYLTACALLDRFVWEPSAESMLRAQLASLPRPPEDTWARAAAPGEVVEIQVGCRRWRRGDPEAERESILADVRRSLRRAVVERRARFRYNLSSKRFRTVVDTRLEHDTAWAQRDSLEPELGALEAAERTLSLHLAKLSGDDADARSRALSSELQSFRRERHAADASRARAGAETRNPSRDDLIPSWAADVVIDDLEASPQAIDFEAQVLAKVLEKHSNRGLLVDPSHREEAIRILRREVLCVEVRGDASGEGGPDVARAIAAARSRATLDLLLGPSSAPTDDDAKLLRSFLSGPRSEASDHPSHGRAAKLVVRERLLPGEHGFRFFPRHYKNLFGLMKRIPLLDEHGEETGFTTFDRLMPTERQSLGLEPERGSRIEEGRHVALLRTLPRSLDEVRRAATEFLQKTGATPSDVARFQLKSLRYLTSGRKRRSHEYESIAWRDFVGLNGPVAHADPELAPPGWGFSAGMRLQIEAAAQALLAYSVAEADTHSYGNFSVQTIVDQVDPDRRVDFILDRPTSLAWFRPWKRWLDQLGVRFFHGSLRAIGRDHRAELDGEAMPERGTEHVFDPDADFYVLAIPLSECTAVLRSLEREAQMENEDHRDLRRTLELYDRFVLAKNRDHNPLRNMSGIQLHFDRAVSWGGVHVYYPSSFWGLSAITQSQHWKLRARSKHGYRGLVSIDISDIGDSTRHPDQPWRPHVLGRGPVSIAAGVHRQIERATPRGPARESIDSSSKLVLPHPDFFHLDEGLRTKGGHRPGPEDPVEENATPYLANLVGQFPMRPGFKEKNGERKIRYAVAGRRWVLAGAHMATFTRMMTMEGSCESGMHAANAIIRAMNKDAYDRTQDFYHGVRENQLIQETEPLDLEEDEIPDLRPLKELDDQLFDAGLPHLFSLFRAERTLVALERGEDMQRDLRAIVENARGVLDHVKIHPARESLERVVKTLLAHAPLAEGAAVRELFEPASTDGDVARLVRLATELVERFTKARAAS